MCACAVGAQARLMSQALRKIAGNASKCDCTVLFLNQLRHKVRPRQDLRSAADLSARTHVLRRLTAAYLR